MRPGPLAALWSGPRCPALLTRRRRRTLSTTSCEVTPTGLSIASRPDHSTAAASPCPAAGAGAARSGGPPAARPARRPVRRRGSALRSRGVLIGDRLALGELPQQLLDPRAALDRG